MCTLCQREFAEGERVCRLVCRHAFHASCWDSYQRHQGSIQGGDECPNCRGAGRIVAVWQYLDPERISQGRPTPRDHPMSSYFMDTENVYHARTRLVDGRPSLLIDPGSVGNLGGDKWATHVARRAHKSGRHPSFEKRSQPLNISGVGHGSQVATYDCKLPIALTQLDGTTKTLGVVNTPTVQDSDLPGLLGLAALRRNRAIIDFDKNQLFFRGPGDYDLMKHLPPGTDGFQCEIAPSGHMVLPCSEFGQSPPRTNQEDPLTLIANESPGRVCGGQ